MAEGNEQQFTVCGAEDVCDAFDDYEQTNSLGHIVVSARSIDEAVKMGNSHFYGKAQDERAAGGFLTS
ncbi:MAG: hypothetical protein KKE20_07005, partial [Nanoarchaeota archaeon]|nr:hypothetical protein [Nanoarchaeota archaeon]